MPLLPYKESAPETLLALWVETFWHSSIEHSGTLRLLPSANLQLLAYSNARGRGLAIVGPMSKFQITNVRAGESFFGARLVVGTKITIPGFNTAVMKDGQVLGSELGCSPIQNFEAALTKSTGTKIMHLDLLNQLVCTLIKEKYLARDTLVDRFIANVRAANGAGSVEQLAAGIPLSDRQLRRRFISYTGLTPKGFIKICRQQAAVKSLKQSAGTIAAIAAASGYSDQAHFNNEFRELIGVTPLTLDDELTLE